MLADDYAVVLDQLFQEIGESYRNQTQQLTGFWPIRGKLYQPRDGLLVVGRAPNGWGNAWTPKDIKETPRRTQEITALRNAGNSTESCPMSWLNEKQGSWTASRSPFFRVSRQITSAIYDVEEFDPEVWSHLAYSNLCKVSPHNGGNPNTSLWNIQLDLCVELLHLELETWRPRVDGGPKRWRGGSVAAV